MNRFDFVPNTPAQNAILSLTAKSPAPQGFSQEMNLSNGPSMRTGPSKKQPAPVEAQLSVDAQPRPNPTHASLAPPPADAEKGLGFEHKAMLSMGLSLLWDALKDFSADVGDFLKIMEQDAANRAANKIPSTPANTHAVPEHKNDPVIDLNLQKKNDLDMLMPEPSNDREMDSQRWLSPETPAQKSGLFKAIEDPKPSVSRAPSPAPSISLSSGPSI
jgi:hypothetical protein